MIKIFIDGKKIEAKENQTVFQAAKDNRIKIPHLCYHPALKMVADETGNRVVPEPGRCIGCGTCANVCPTNLIQVKDQEGVRTISIKDEIIGRLPLERCEGCGNLYATENFLNHVEEIMGLHPETKEHHHLCSSCTKLLSNRAVTEKERIQK